MGFRHIEPSVNLKLPNHRRLTLKLLCSKTFLKLTSKSEGHPQLVASIVVLYSSPLRSCDFRGENFYLTSTSPEHHTISIVEPYVLMVETLTLMPLLHYGINISYLNCLIMETKE